MVLSIRTRIFARNQKIIKRILSLKPESFFGVFSMANEPILHQLPNNNYYSKKWSKFSGQNLNEIPKREDDFLVHLIRIVKFFKHGKILSILPSNSLILILINMPFSRIILAMA